MGNRHNKKVRENISINESDYQLITNIFQKNKDSFYERLKSISKISFSRINWSDSYLDFTPYDSIISQIKPVKVYEKEGKGIIKNCFVENFLVYSVHTENENWGSVFIDYSKDSKEWFLFSENIDEEVVLQQLKVAYTEEEKIKKIYFYMLDEDLDEETFILYLFDYDEKDRVKTITKVGFYEDQNNILPKQLFSFTYSGEQMQIDVMSQN